MPFPENKKIEKTGSTRARRATLTRTTLVVLLVSAPHCSRSPSLLASISSGEEEEA